MKIEKRTIFTALSCVGVVGTAFLSAEGGRRAGKTGKSFKETWKYYIPGALAAALSIGCAVISHGHATASITALTSASAYLVANRDAVEKKLRETVGDKAVDDVKKKLAFDISEKELSKHQTIEETGYGNVLCIEGYSGRLFRSSMEHVDEAIAKFKDLFKNDLYCCFNDFYEFLGIETTHFGHQYGYANNDDYYDSELDIRAELLSRHDEDIYVIDVYTYPMECWQEV